MEYVIEIDVMEYESNWKIQFTEWFYLWYIKAESILYNNHISSIDHLDLLSQHEQGSYMILTYQRNMSRLLHWSLVSFKMEIYNARVTGI